MKPIGFGVLKSGAGGARLAFQGFTPVFHNDGHHRQRGNGVRPPPSRDGIQQ